MGHHVVQFAKAGGARVLATASGEEGVRLVRRLGVDVAIDGQAENLADAARAFAPQGVNALLALVGGEPLTELLRSGIEVIAYDPVSAVPGFRRLNRAVERAALKVPIAAVYKLEEALESHKRLAAGHALGKIVLKIRQAGGRLSKDRESKLCKNQFDPNNSSPSFRLLE